jgi:hypothetical protein
MKGLKLIKLSILGLFLALGLSSMSLGHWNHLGSRTVNYGLDHDKIMVTAKEGYFTKLKMNVTGSLNMHKVKINFRNGTTQVLHVSHQFIRGRDSKVLDLKGGKRIIQSVDFWYDTKNRARHKATIHLYGN